MIIELEVEKFGSFGSLYYTEALEKRIALAAIEAARLQAINYAWEDDQNGFLMLLKKGDIVQRRMEMCCERLFNVIENMESLPATVLAVVQDIKNEYSKRFEGFEEAVNDHHF